MKDTHVLLLVSYALLNFLPLLHGMITLCARSPAQLRIDFQIFFDTYCCRSYVVVLLYVCSLTFVGLLFWLVMVVLALATIFYAVCCPPCVAEYFLPKEATSEQTASDAVAVAEVQVDVEGGSTLSDDTDPLYSE